MRVKVLVDNPRLNEMLGVLLLLVAAGTLLSLVSYSPLDPSANVAADDDRATNWMGLAGALAADLVLQSVGLVGFTIPVWILLLAVNRIRNATLDRPLRKALGILLLMLVGCCALGMGGDRTQAALPEAWQGSVWAGGTFGKVVASGSTAVFNVGGTILWLLAFSFVGVYVLTNRKIADLFGRSDRAVSSEATPESEGGSTKVIRPPNHIDDPQGTGEAEAAPSPTVVNPAVAANQSQRSRAREGRETQGTESGLGVAAPSAPPVAPYEDGVEERTSAQTRGKTVARRTSGSNGKTNPLLKTDSKDHLPRPTLLNPPSSRPPFNEILLQSTARQIVGKFEEFGVHGAVNQINPGPVVTTFEFKPDRGIKYSKVVNLSEDLCLALECESVRVERIPGKPTVGIEVPNKNREIIHLREVVDSKDFRKSKSMLTFALGKDIDGRIHCADLASMPHLLVAGQTGSGKSVMINCVIMSILLRAAPEQVRLILVDPKTVELSPYKDIPHLLTPVITDMRMATNALKNATREMDRRLQLLAKYGVRNIGQFNQKVDRLKKSKSELDGEDEIEKLPYVVVIVDELADLMMTSRGQVEESIQRLAQMARAVGIHLMLATQRPSVDVITGLIKANIPARLSFLLATRVDSRTILDSMGAETLLGKGDMLFLPPGVGRVRRFHGPLVTEDEIEAVVSHWKDLASPQYETGYLESPDGDDQKKGDGHAGFDDPKYKDAVRLVLQMGKASTSILQRRLRLGYGRAARLLDAMQEDGIIGPPDGSRPREVLKRPDWLDEVNDE